MLLETGDILILMKNYSKKKQDEVSGPEASSPGFRTSDFQRTKNIYTVPGKFRAQNFSRGGQGFNPASFKGPQHKG